MTFRRNTEAFIKSTKKRLRGSEEEPSPLPENTPPAKRAKSTVSDKSQPLTEELLEKHTLREGYLDTIGPMGSEVDKVARSKGSKRSASGVGIGSGSIASTGRDPETASQVSQKSSFTAAHYRNCILKGANLNFQFRRAPENILGRITTIVRLEVSPERKEELSHLALKLYNSFADVLDIAAREDDCLELFYQALSSMGYDKCLTFPRKAGMVALLHLCTIQAYFFSRLAAKPQAAHAPYEGEP